MYQVIILTGSPDDKNLDAPRIPTLGAYKCAHVLRDNGFSCLVVNNNYILIIILLLSIYFFN